MTRITTNQLLILVGVLVVILIGVSVYVFAILLPNAGQTALTDLTPTPSATIAVATKVKLRRVVGTIQSLSGQSLIITLNNGKKTMTVNVDSQTTYTDVAINATVAFSDLKVGQKIEVHGRIDPQDTTTILATSIVIKA